MATPGQILGVYGAHRADSARLEQCVRGESPLDRTRSLRDDALAVTVTGGAALGRTSGGTAAAFDGHLHNARALSAELGLASSETAEVVVATAFERWGEGMLDRLRGDFLLLVWSRHHEKGLLARDQLGNRSMYLHSSGGRLLFASELRLLLRALPRRPAPDGAAVISWLAKDGTPGTSTMYEGIERLMPGHLVRLTGGHWTTRRYWQPRYDSPLEGSRDEIVDLVASTLRSAVDARLDGVADSGILLSGGLDSASVAAVGSEAAEARGSVLRAYSAAFPGHPLADESALVDATADQLGLSLVRQYVSGGSVLAGALEFQRRWEVPLVSPNDFFWHPLLVRAAQDGVGVMLDGEGGDELFGLSPYLLADDLRHGRLLSAARLARRWPMAWQGRRPRTGLRVIRNWALPGISPHWLDRGRHHLAWKRRAHGWLTPESANRYAEMADPWAWKSRRAPRWWAYLSWVLTEARETQGVAEHLRRCATAAGLEARPPLLDLSLVELALRLPPEMSFDPTFTRPLLREAMSGRLPDAVRLRPFKSHFGTIFSEALAGSDLGAVQRLLGSPHAEVFAFAQADVVRRQILSPPTGPEVYEWAMNVWRLVTAECWLRSQSDPELPDRLLAQWGLALPLLTIDSRSAPSAAKAGDRHFFQS